MDIKKLAEMVDKAAVEACAIPQLSHSTPFSVDEAYEIQRLSINRRLDRGENFIGVKLGFTSKAKMEQMGVHDMIWGRLTDAMLLENGGTLPFSQFIHPRAEPEICFLVKKEISGSISEAELSDYIGGVAAAIEIIDSRYEQFKFSLEDVIADNCSSAGLVIGPWHQPDFSIQNLKMDLVIDGIVVESGSSEAILGDPWESVIAAARLGAQYGQIIPAGSVLMAGAATSAVFIKPGQSVEAVVEKLGKVEFQVGP